MNAQDLKKIIAEFYNEPVTLATGEELKEHLVENLTARIVKFQMDEISQQAYGTDFESLPASDQRNLQYLFDMGVLKL